ncbi:unnamed protein product, partial [marine sediment metagenome]
MPFAPPPSQRDDLEALWTRFLDDLWGLIRESPSCVVGNCGYFNVYKILVRADWRNLWNWVEKRIDLVTAQLDAYIDVFILALFNSLDNAFDWLSITWERLGDDIKSGAYTAVSWAVAKKYEAIAWARARYDTARSWASSAWDWVRDRGPTTWDWIRDKSWTVWQWINDKSDIVWDFVG